MSRSRKINTLLVYPISPPSTWGYHFALPYLGRKANMPPLGLLTVAAFFPDHYDCRLVDLNVNPLDLEDILWADYVCISAMIVHKTSMFEIIRLCNLYNKPVITGGPYPTSYREEIEAEFCNEPGVAHYLLGEVEDYFADFLEDLEAGRARRIYVNQKKPNITKVPLPRYDLIDMDQYYLMPVQYSRGCPFDCEFCDITKLYGRVPRTKTERQFINELDYLYDQGWRRYIFVVDDNFIGNKRNTLRLLSSLIEWRRTTARYLDLATEASLNVVEIPNMLGRMRDAGFGILFVGIESPSDKTLLTTQKGQNTNSKNRQETAYQYMLRGVQTIQQHGIEVTAGFIIGLDGDTEFESHVRFIREAGIMQGMVNILQVLNNTNLYNRLQQENRLLPDNTDSLNSDMRVNFIPQLPESQILQAYENVIDSLYGQSLQCYIERIETFLRLYRHNDQLQLHSGWRELSGSIRFLAKVVLRRSPLKILRYLFKNMLVRPGQYKLVYFYLLIGYHFEEFYTHKVRIYRLGAAVVHRFSELRDASNNETPYSDLLEVLRHSLVDINSQASGFSKLFQYEVNKILHEFRENLLGLYSNGYHASDSEYARVIQRYLPGHTPILSPMTEKTRIIFNQIINRPAEQSNHGKTLNDKISDVENAGIGN